MCARICAGICKYGAMQIMAHTNVWSLVLLIGCVTDLALTIQIFESYRHESKEHLKTKRLGLLTFRKVMPAHHRKSHGEWCLEGNGIYLRRAQSRPWLAITKSLNCNCNCNWSCLLVSSCEFSNLHSHNQNDVPEWYSNYIVQVTGTFCKCFHTPARIVIITATVEKTCCQTKWQEALPDSRLESLLALSFIQIDRTTGRLKTICLISAMDWTVHTGVSEEVSTHTPHTRIPTCMHASACMHA